MPKQRFCLECGSPTASYRHRYCGRDCAIWHRVDRSGGPDACWMWTGRVNEAGYGRIAACHADGGTILAHRWAYILTYGDPGPLQVMHSCDVPGCTNPRHLSAGTAMDNHLDALARGRKIVGAYGRRNYSARLDEDTVRLIRISTESSYAIACSLGMSNAAILDVRHGKTWGHVQ